MKNKIVVNSILICVVLIASWIMDITTWIHDNIYSDNGFLRIDVYNANLIYHLLWYLVLFICIFFIIKDMLKK